MKKGIFIILGLLVLGLISVYAQSKDIDVELYEKIVIENEYGKFEICFDFAVIRQKGVISKLIVFNSSRIKLEIIPEFVLFYGSKDGYFSFDAIILQIPPPVQPGIYQEKDMAYFVNSRGERIQVKLSICTKDFRDISLEKLEKWQILLKQAYDGRVPVTVVGMTSNLKCTGDFYCLIIDAWNVYKN